MKRLAVLSTLLLAPALAAQQVTFRGGTLTIPVYATVLDDSGRLVTDLEKEHFEILDNGEPQTITVFKSDVQPISVVVMLDTSGSMTMNLLLLKQAAEQFVIRLLPADRARLGSFSDTIIIDPLTFTSDRDELIRILHTDIQYGNPTYLWDAISESMDALVGSEGRRVVLVFTDGKDDKSQRVKFDDLFDRARKDDIMIYGIGLRSRILGQITEPDGNLRKLALETGGGYFDLPDNTRLAPTFTRVADELHRQYVLGFVPQAIDGLLHTLDVRVKVDGMTARARKSYVAARAPVERPQ